MVPEGSFPGCGREEISDTHARGLRRDLFRWMKYRLVPHFPRFMRRLQTVNLPHPSHRERMAAYWRTRKLLRDCSDFYTENYEDKVGHSFGVLVVPTKRTHEDGHEEPVLGVFLYTLTLRVAGQVRLTGIPCGRISHHAIERMYQRLHTSSHQVVFDELRTALWWVPMLQGMSSQTRRSAVIHQLPVPTQRGVLRCIRDVEAGLLEVRTFTLNRTGSRFDRSLATLRRWQDLPREDRETGFAAMLRHCDNRWWRERYSRSTDPIATH